MAEDLKNNVNPVLPVVLISPLDWGMGHTTRCIPIIKALTNLSCSVLIACNSAQKEILSKEFPSIPIIPLKGYNISYRKGKLGTLFKIIRQIPKILTSIKEERYFLEDLMANQKIDLIISDNRYGLFHPNAFSVIMTHQLGLRSGIGKWADRQAQRQLYRFISLFDLCLVPDHQEPNSIAGELSNPSQLPSTPVKYIGPLTRFSHRVEKQYFNHVQKSENHTLIDDVSIGGKIHNQTTANSLKKILVILSGPEPQRTILEEKILKQIKNLSYDFTIVRGVGSEKINTKGLVEKKIENQKESSASTNFSTPLNNSANSKIRIIDFADSTVLEKLIDESELVICRSGYTSIMDLLLKRKKAIMIPTPGQGEQEYLAKKLTSDGYIISCNQSDLRLKELIEKAEFYPFKVFPIKAASNNNPGISNLLEETLKEIIGAAVKKKSALTFAVQTS